MERPLCDPCDLWLLLLEAEGLLIPCEAEAGRGMSIKSLRAFPGVEDEEVEAEPPDPFDELELVLSLFLRLAASLAAITEALRAFSHSIATSSSSLEKKRIKKLKQSS